MGIILLWIICLGFPLCGLYVCLKENKRAYVPFAIGIAVFSIAQICLRVPIFSFLNTNETFFTWASSNALVYIIILSTSAALVEEIGRWLGYRFMNNSTVFTAIAFGLGHAFMEAMYVALIPYLSYGMDMSIQVYMLASLERLFSIVVQVSLALLVWKAYQEHSLSYVLTAGFLHMIYILVPSIMTILMPTSTFVGNVVLLLMTIAILWYAHTTVWKTMMEDDA